MKQKTPLHLHQPFRGKVPRVPLRTFSELCAELGVAEKEMKARLRHSPTAPKPELYCEGHGKGSTRIRANSWYKPAAFRAWWHSLNTQQVAA